jgi:hypothetical protein
MLAYVKNGQLVNLSNAVNVEWDGRTIPNVYLLTPEERKAAGIYNFAHAAPVPAYHRAGATTYTIDDVAGVVTESVEAVPLSKAEVAEARKADLAAYRYRVETGGVTVGGTLIASDRQSQAMIAGAKLFADMNPAAMIDWKGASGWVQIDAAAVTAIANAVGDHVQACFSAERIHAEALDAIVADTAGTADDLIAHDITTGWPA